MAQVELAAARGGRAPVSRSRICLSVFVSAAQPVAKCLSRVLLRKGDGEVELTVAHAGLPAVTRSPCCSCSCCTTARPVTT